MPPRDTMTVFSRPPCAALRSWVKRFLVVEFLTAQEDAHLPETGLIAAFPFRGECRLENGQVVGSVAVTGLTDRLRRHRHTRGNGVALAVFTPLGAAAFLRGSLDAVANATVDWADLEGGAPAFAAVQECLADAPDHAHRAQLVENFLLARIRQPEADPLVAAAVDWLERRGPGARIEQLVRHIGLSQSALERRFRRVVGTSPRRFASLLRLQQIERLRENGATWTAIAHAAGYFDQAHFIHDFRRVTGQAPEAYFTRGPGG